MKCVLSTDSSVSITNQESKQKMKREKIQKNISLLMVVILISKIVGMFRDVVLAKYYGTSNISDAYLVSNSVPTLLFYFIGHGLSTAFIPMYTKIKETQGAEKAERYTNNIINISLIFCTVIIVVLQVFPAQVVGLFAAGFDESTTALASQFIKISSYSLYFRAH